MTACERLPNRRWNESFEFFHSGLGFFENGRPGECLQAGVDIGTIRQALTRGHDGSAATAIGAALDALAEAP